MPKRVLPLEDYIVRIEKHDGTKLGTGFFVGPDEVLPSAHIFKGIPDPIGDVRLVAPIRRPPTAGDAHVDKLFPKTWDVDQVFPDIAWLTVQPNVSNRKFLRLREGWLLDDIVWGAGFSDESPQGDSYKGG